MSRQGCARTGVTACLLVLIGCQGLDDPNADLLIGQRRVGRSATPVPPAPGPAVPTSPAERQLAARQAVESHIQRAPARVPSGIQQQVAPSDSDFQRGESHAVTSMSAAALPHPTADVGTPATALASSPVVEWVSVSPVRQMAAEPPPAGYSANMTVAAQGAPHGSPPAAKAVLEQAVRADPNDVEQQLKLRYHHLSEGRVDLATARPEGMDPRRAERLIKWMQAQEDAQQLIESGVVPRDAAERFDALAALIRQRSELQIARVELCSSIQSYGRFSAIPDDFFVAGANNRAYVYCELKNFASTEDKEGYRAHVAHRLELLTLDGRVLWEDTEFLDVVDVCRNRRTDFFFNRLWQLPAGLPAGDYILNVIIEDRLKAQRTEAKRPLTIRLPGLGGLRS